MTYKKGDKVCIDCAKVIDRKNSSLPWHSEQIKEKNKYIEELLERICELESCQKCGCNEFLCGHSKRV